MKSSNLSSLSMLEHHIQYPSDTRYNTFFVQTCSLRVWTRSSVVWNSFEWEAKHVWTSSQTCSNEKPEAFEWPNTFKRKVNCVWIRNQMRLNEKPKTHSNEKLNVFAQEAKCVRTKSQTRSNEKSNAFEREAKCVRMRNWTRSLKIWNPLKRDSKRLLIASETRSKLSPDSLN